MAEAAAEIGRAAHLPEQPGQALRARRARRSAGRRRTSRPGAAGSRRDSNTRIGFGPLRSISAGIFEFGLIATKPLPNWSPSLMRISQASYSAPAWPQRQQLLQHDRDLHAVGRGQRIELQRMPADRQLLVVRRAGDRAVDVGEPAAVRLVPGPDFRRRVLGRAAHAHIPAVRRKHGRTAADAQAAAGSSCRGAAPSRANIAAGLHRAQSACQICETCLARPATALGNQSEALIKDGKQRRE